MNNSIRSLKFKFKDIVIFILILIFSFVLFLFINKEISRKMEILKANTMQYLEAKIGRKISYDSISPSIFMFLEIRNLRIFDFDDPEDYLLQINKIRIYYNIFLMIFNDDPLVAISEINLNNSQFNIDWEKDYEIINLVRSIDFSAPEEKYNIILSGSNLDFLFTYNDYIFEFNQLFFYLSDTEDIVSFNLQKADFAIYAMEGEEYKKQLESRIQSIGNVDMNLEWIDLQLTLGSFSTDIFSVSDQTFQVVYKDNKFEITKIKDKAPIDINLVFEWDELKFWADFKTQDFILLDELTFKENLSFINEWISASITSKGNIYFDLKQNLLEYNVSVNALISNKFITSELNISSNIFGDETKANLKPLFVSSSMGSIKFTGDILIENLFAQGSLSLIEVKSSSGEDLNASFEVTRDKEHMSVYGTDMTVGTTGFSDFVLTVYPGPDKVFFYLDTKISDSFENNRILSKGEFTYLDDTNGKSNLTVDFEFKNISLLHIYRMISPYQYDLIDTSEDISNLAINSEINFSTDFNNLELSSSYFKVKDFNNPNNFIMTSFSLTSEYLKISNFFAAWNKNTMYGKLDASFINNSLTHSNQIDVQTQFVINNSPYKFEIQYIPDYSINFTGSYNLSGNIQIRHNQYTFSIKSEKFYIPIKDENFYITLKLNGNVNKSDDWYIDSSSVTFYNIPMIKTKDNFLDLSFSYNSNILDIENIKYSDNISKLNGYGNFSINSIEDLTGSINLSDTNTKETYLLTCKIDGPEINVNIDFIELPISRFSSNTISGKATGVFSITNTIEDPYIDLNLSINSARFLNDPVTLNLLVSYNNEQIFLSYLNLYYLNHHFYNTNAWYDLNTGKFSFVSQYSSEYFTNTIESNISFSGEITDKIPGNQLNNIDNILINKNITANLVFKDNILNNISSPNLSINFYTENNNLYFIENNDNSIKGYITHDNSFEIELQAPLPFTCFAHGQIIENTIDAEINNINFDMKLLNPLIGEEVVLFEDGTANGYLSITGLVNDPDFNGRLFTEDVIVSFYLTPDITEYFSTTLVFQEKTLKMNLIQTKAGNTTIFAEGNFIFSHWVISEYELDFWTDQVTGLHIVYDFGSIFIDGYAKGNINVVADEYSIDINSDILIYYSKITMGDETENIDDDNNYDDIPYQVNLEIESGKNVDFFWPAFNFPIFRTNVKLGSMLSLNYSDITQELDLIGDIELLSGDVFYFNRNFYIKSGKFSFNEHSTQIDPRITLEAEIRERDQNNQEIKIFLIVNNKKLSEFEPDFRSEPSRSYLEITALLGAPLQQQLSENAGLSALLLSTDIVSQFGLIRPFEQRIRKAFNLDLFSIRTKIFQNVLLKRFLDVDENSISGRQDAFGNYLDNTSITIGKYLGEDIFLEALFNFKRKQNQDIITELFLSIEFPTPFFDLEWELSPKFDNTNNSFPISNSITFSWDISF